MYNFFVSAPEYHTNLGFMGYYFRILLYTMHQRFRLWVTNIHRFKTVVLLLLVHCLLLLPLLLFVGDFFLYGSCLVLHYLDVASDVGVNLCNVKSCLNTSNNEIFTDKRGDLPCVNISKL